MDEDQREVLIGLSDLLTTLGSANDAEDHAYIDDADRMRQESCESIQRLLANHAFLEALLPSLEWELKSGHILNFGWANLKQVVEAALQTNGNMK